MKRNLINKAKTIHCEICASEISLYGMTNHLRFKHRDEITERDYIEKYGDYRKQKPASVRNIKRIKCEICGLDFSISGIHNHFRDSHNGMTPDEYVAAGFSEYRPLKLQTISFLNKNKEKFRCLICNEVCNNEKHLTIHLSTKHSVSKLEYIQKHILFDGIPKCACGCGKEVKIILQYPYHRTLIAGHALKGENHPSYGRIHTNEELEKMRISTLGRMNDKSGKWYKSTLEKYFEDNFLKKNNIKFDDWKQTEYGCIDYYLPDFDLYVEIDGSYFHPTEYVNLNAQLLQSACSQKKRHGMTNLVRIREDDVYKLNCIDDLFKYNYQYSFEIDYYQVIVHKSYFINSNVDLSKVQPLLLKFIRTFQPTFPKIEARENLQDVVLKIQKYNISHILKNNTFNNGCSNIGNSYLKSKFISYWNAAFKNVKSPVQAWSDEYILKRIIKYRTGDNKTKEVFDFSLHQMVRGLSALRYTVSFFKPILAASIYTHFLNNKQTPIVFDPCCGFGGRLLGFKAKFPNGTYIGCEPNTETFNELQELSKNFTDVYLYNCKIEDFDLNTLPDNLDLTFTSIPYYDLETYSNPVIYESFEHWKQTFLTKIKHCPKLVLNVPNSLREHFSMDCQEYFISSNTSHFNKSENKKTEFLLDLRK